MCSFKLSRSLINRMIFWLIQKEAEKGLLMSRKLKSIRKATYMGYGHYLLDIFEEQVKAYAETNQYLSCLVLRSVVVAEEFRGSGLAQRMARIAMDSAWQSSPEKKILLACHPDRVSLFEKLGFVLQKNKEGAPEEVRAGRSNEEWLASDRVWMICPPKSH